MQSKNKFRFTLFLVLNLIFLQYVVFSQDINNYEYLKLDIGNKISFSVKEDYLPYIKNIDLNSYFFPQTIEEAQYLNSFTSNLNYNLQNNSGILSLNYKFDKNHILTENKFQNKFIVESTLTRPKITSKIPYPITYSLHNNLEYLKFSSLINTNYEIKKQASLLGDGENDVYLIASKIAKWVQEDIKYDLSTITALPNQNSVEVFNTKRGVCKEITNLYISMLRSIGIPARVVTGYAWTNSEEILKYVMYFQVSIKLWHESLLELKNMVYVKIINLFICNFKLFSTFS